MVAATEQPGNRFLVGRPGTHRNLTEMVDIESTKNEPASNTQISGFPTSQHNML